MTQLLLGMAILAAVTIVPVMIAARLVGAHKTGFGAAVFALILQIALASALLSFGPGAKLALILSIVGGAVIYAMALDTTVLRGFAVSLLVAVIGSAMVYFIAGAFVTGSAVIGLPS